MRTYNDDSAVVALEGNHVLAREKRDVCYAAHYLDDCRRCPEHEDFSLAHCTEQSDAEHLDIDIVHSVHDYLVEALDGHELGFYLVESHCVNVVEAYARNAVSLELSAGFLLNVAGHCRGSVAERLIFRELCLVCGHKFIAVLHVMNVVDGEASALLEERAQNLAVNHFARVLLVVLAEYPCFERVMASERRIASADEDVLSACLAGNVIHDSSNLVMCLDGLLLSEAARICEHVEQVVLLLKSGQDVIMSPARVDVNIMHSLNACRVIIEDDNLCGVSGYLCGEELINLRFINLRV